MLPSCLPASFPRIHPFLFRSRDLAEEWEGLRAYQTKTICDLFPGNPIGAVQAYLKPVVSPPVTAQSLDLFNSESLQKSDCLCPKADQSFCPTTLGHPASRLFICNWEKKYQQCWKKVIFHSFQSQVSRDSNKCCISLKLWTKCCLSMPLKRY